MSQLSPNSGATNGDCNGKIVSVRDNGQQIMITLRLHNDNTSAKIETYFLFLCGKKIKFIEYVSSEQGIKDHGSTHISSFSV